MHWRHGEALPDAVFSPCDVCCVALGAGGSGGLGMRVCVLSARGLLCGVWNASCLDNNSIDEIADETFCFLPATPNTDRNGQRAPAA
jgi:hypothetical protein